MSYDLNVLVLDQKKVVVRPFESSLQLINEKEEVLRYKDIWQHMTKTKGVWYSIGIEKDGWFNTLDIIDVDYEKRPDKTLLPFWVKDEDILSNLKPMRIYDKYKEDLNRNLEFFINCSPIKTIMILTRFQGGEYEIIYGTMKFNEFKELLNNGMILTNICYIITE